MWVSRESLGKAGRYMPLHEQFPLENERRDEMQQHVCWKNKLECSSEFAELRREARVCFRMDEFTISIGKQADHHHVT